MKNPYYISADEILAAGWPEDLVRPGEDVLRQIYFRPGELQADPIAGLFLETGVVVDRPVELGLPGFELLRIGFGESSDPIELYCGIHPKVRLSLGPVPVRVLVRHALLVPVERREVDGIQRFTPTDGQVSVQIEGASLEYSENQGLRLTNPLVVSIPPFMIRGTGLVLGLDEVSFILRDRDWIPELVSVGFDRDFRGIHAAAATLYWLPEIRLNGFPLPGLRLDFEQLAIGSPGVNFDLALSWEVGFDDAGEFDTDSTELLGSFLADDWQIAVHRATGRLRANVPESFSVDTYLKIPFFAAIFSASFGMAYRQDTEFDAATYDIRLRISKESHDPIEASFPGVTLMLRHLEATGVLDQDGFSLSGRAGFELDIQGFQLSVAAASGNFTHAAGEDELVFELRNLRLGELGRVPLAQLELAGRTTADGNYQLTLLLIQARLRWAEVKHLVPLDEFDIEIPDDGEIAAEISWRELTGNAGGGNGVVVELQTQVSHLDDLWGFIPGEYRPEILGINSFFRITYDSTEAFTAEVRDQSRVHIQLSARLQLRLPPALEDLDIPGMEILDIRAGDAGSMVTAEYVAEYTSAGEEAVFTTGLDLQQPFGLGIYLPGGRSGQPFIDVTMTRIGLGLAAGDTVTADSDGPAGAEAESLSGRLLLEGSFRFLPLLPTSYPFAQQLNSLLREVGLDTIDGVAGLRLEISGDGFDMRLYGEFEAFGIDLDLFQLLSSLSPNQSAPGGSEIDIDFDIGFRLIGFEIAIGSNPDATPGNKTYFRFDLRARATISP